MITVNAGNLVIRDQSQITSLTRGPAPAGTITVTAGTLLIDSALARASSQQFTTGIISSAESGSSGDAGTVIVHADNLTLGTCRILTFLVLVPAKPGTFGLMRRTR